MENIELAPEFIVCDVCKGSGHLPHFVHVDGGICYQCDGAGEVERKAPVELGACPVRARASLERLRNMYRAAKSQIFEESDPITAAAWVRESSGYCAGAQYLALLADVPAADKARAMAAFDALGVTVKLAQAAANEARARAADRAARERKYNAAKTA